MINNIRKYTSASYKPLARGDGYYDCWGLVMGFYKDEYGIELFDYGYSDTHDFEKNSEIYKQEELSNSWSPVSKPIKGDMVVFNIAGSPVHVGIMVDENRFMHAHESCDVSIERLDSPRWRKRIEGIYRHKRNIG